MSKAIAEQSNALSIFWLKKHGCVPVSGGWRSGSIKWTYGLSEDANSIGFTVTTNGDGYDNIRLQYTYTNQRIGEKIMDFKISLATTPCNYGGVRYWFICPLYKNGQCCGRQVGVLFSIGERFGCRHCGEIAYGAQMSGGKFRVSSVSMPDIEKAGKEVKRYYYNGKPTRKYRRFIRLNERIETSFAMLAARLDKRFARFADLKK